ncbi:kinase-like domain, phloem protein 2-like protein [Tanacetum coccineum]
MCMCLKDHMDAAEWVQHTLNLKNSLDFEEEILEEEVQEHEARALSDEEAALDEAASEARSSGGEEMWLSALASGSLWLGVGRTRGGDRDELFLVVWDRGGGGEWGSVLGRYGWVGVMGFGHFGKVVTVSDGRNVMEMGDEEERKIHSSPNHLAHLRIPLEDIETATNYFDVESIIEEGEFGKIYKGQLLWSGELIDITAGRLTNKEWDDEKEQQFWTDISMLSSLKHKNVVSIVGFCNEVGAETIIYKDEFMGTLEKNLSDVLSLTWVKRLEISVSIAHALSYIHYDESRAFSVRHGNINSKTVLLNNDLAPKLFEFQHAMMIKAFERHNSFHTDSVWSTNGYTDPTCLVTNTVSQKSDIYSFGIVLLELLCARKSVIDDQDNKYLAPVAIYHYEKNELDGIIDPNLWKQMDPQSFNIFAKTAYNCLNEERPQRPNISEIVKRLEKALDLQLEHENVVHSLAAAKVEGISSNHEKKQNLSKQDRKIYD